MRIVARIVRCAVCHRRRRLVSAHTRVPPRLEVACPCGAEEIYIVPIRRAPEPGRLLASPEVKA